MRHLSSRVLLSFCCVIGLGSCGFTPTHEVQPKPEHIKAGVEPGETVVITTKDGRELEFVVAEIDADGIIGHGERVPFSDIETIAIRSWKEPRHPCSGGKPVGCSIPEVILAISEEYAEQAEKFHKSCIEHDFCYRHGYATYGVTREECDARFYENMKTECKSDGILGLLDVENYGICQIAADQTYRAVRRYGAKGYQTTTSTYCEYR